MTAQLSFERWADIGLAAYDRTRATASSLQWRHGEHDGVSNHQPHDCLLNHLIRCRSKKTSKLRVTGLCEGNSPVTGEFPAQRASNAENVSIWWRHHGVVLYTPLDPPITPTTGIMMTSTTGFMMTAGKPCHGYRHFVRGSHSLTKVVMPLMPSFAMPRVASLNKLQNKRSSFRWFETSWSSRDITAAMR